MIRAHIIARWCFYNLNLIACTSHTNNGMYTDHWFPAPLLKLFSDTLRDQQILHIFWLLTGWSWSPWVSRKYCTRWGPRKWHHMNKDHNTEPSCIKLLSVISLPGPPSDAVFSANPRRDECNSHLWTYKIHCQNLTLASWLKLLITCNMTRVVRKSPSSGLKNRVILPYR